MNRKFGNDGYACWCIPRTCGDEPVMSLSLDSVEMYSPHVRG